jgi:hypothetical protein
MAWVSYMFSFGTVEVLEKWDTSIVLCVCVDPHHAPYYSRFVLCRCDYRNGLLIVMPPDKNRHVLFPDDRPKKVRDADQGPGLLIEFPVSVLEEPAIVIKRPRSYRLRSKKHGAATIDTDTENMIVNASGQFGAFVGMDFFNFIHWLRQDDVSVKYRRFGN